MKKWLPALAMALMFVATSATAEVLWDQSVPDAANGGVNDSQSGCAPSGTTLFHANDVTFNLPVEIQSITTWYTASDPDFEVYATTAYLMIVPKTGPAPVWPDDDPTQVATVPVTVTESGGYKLLNASGLSIILEPGDYWVTFSPIAMTPLGVTDQHMIATTQIGDGVAFLPICDPFTPSDWYPASAFFGIDLDTTLRIEGVSGAVANDSVSWGATKSLYR